MQDLRARANLRRADDHERLWLLSQDLVEQNTPVGASPGRQRFKPNRRGHGSRYCRASPFLIPWLILATGGHACRELPRSLATGQYDGAAVIPRSAPGPTLTLVDSVILVEADTAFLGRLPHAPTVDRTGAIYVADRSSDRLLRFSRNGALEAVLGRHGNGPGEFNRIRGLTVPLDTVILQGLEGGTVVAIDARNGQELNRFQTIGRLNSWSRNGPTLVLGLLAPGRDAAVARVVTDSLLLVPGEVAPTLVTPPRVFREYPQLAAVATVHVESWRDSLVVGFGPTNLLIRTAFGSVEVARFDTIRVPVRLRRGAPASHLDRFRDPNITSHDAVSSISMLMGIWRLRSGHLLAWYQDGVMEDPKNPRSQLLATAFLTVLSPGLDRACADAELRAAGTGLPRLTLHGDTLYSLDQLIDQEGGGAGTVRTVVRRYVVDTDGCKWYSTQ